MTDLIATTENLRRSERMSQAEVAREMGISQGHYSKVVAKRVPLAPKMATRVTVWLQQRETTSAGVDHEIITKCMELMHLLQERVRSAPESEDKPG
ncbi:MAG: helix-turn-helix transcriptional regulator [Boseongicola sp. SB0662_bin_57]|nr:helix-turn-helix transcriptional regulator [Boseongicola sp. SB0662_bin_57]